MFLAYPDPLLAATAAVPPVEGYIPLMKGVGTTMKTMLAPSAASDTSVVATTSSLSLIPGKYGVFSWVLLNRS